MIHRWQQIIIKDLHVSGMALFPLLLVKRKELISDKVFMNHERIHFRQQVELLIIPFYILYLSNYFLNRFRYKDHDTAYRNICFEREAYFNEKDMQYLSGRKLFSWLRFVGRNKSR